MEDVAVRPISQIEGDDYAIVVSWGPLHADATHYYTVRNVPISRTQIKRENSRGQLFRLCIFPDFREMWVNEGNIRGHKIHRFAGGTK